MQGHSVLVKLVYIHQSWLLGLTIDVRSESAFFKLFLLQLAFQFLALLSFIGGLPRQPLVTEVRDGARPFKQIVTRGRSVDVRLERAIIED